MYLKRLEMSGFKSFADRTELEFVPGITAVVGPNGSGKSNVTDGIRWVLGEQSAKSLRGNKMEDVIFAGSDTRKPVGYCEVSITFDNSDRRLPLDYAEVTVTRRVYRSGESEYLLNRQSCRLKDIHELFLDTGIGKDAYSMIGQGKIDEILSSKSEDRRIIFEEAAGISKYKTRKKEAEKKLDNTEQNLARIHDLIHELETQVEPLAEQAEKAQRFKELKTELQNVEIGLYVHKIEAIHNEWQQAAQEVKQLKENQVSLAAEVSTKEAALEELKGKLQEQEQRWEEVQTQLLSVSEELEKAEGQKEVRMERVRNRTETQQHLREQIRVLESECTRLREEENKVKERLKEKKEALRHAEDQLAVLKQQLSLSSDDVAKRLLELTEKHNLQGQKLAALTSEKQYVSEQREELSERINALEAQEKQYVQERQEQDRQAEKLSVQLKEVEEDLKQAAQEVRTLAGERTEMEQEEKALTLQSRQAEQQLNRLRSKWEWMKEMEAEHQGFMQGVKEVLRARDRGIPALKGVHGAVAELIQVPAEMEAAMETALGGALQHIVVDDEATARSGIVYLKEKRLGRATFLPLDVMRARSLSAAELERCRSVPGFVGIAADLIRTDERYRALMQNLLGLVVVTKTLEQANQMARTLSYRYRIVTLDGDVVNPGGSMTGGSRQQSKSNLLGRSRQLEELEKQIKEAERVSEKIQQQFAALRERKQKLEQDWERVRLRGEERRVKEQELHGRERELAVQKRAVEEQLKSIAAERKQALAKNEQLTRHFQRLEQEIEQLRREQTRLEQMIREAEDLAKQAASDKEEAGERMTELRVTVAQLRQELANLEEIGRRLAEDYKRSSKQLGIAKKEWESLGSQQEFNQQEMGQLEQRINDLRQQKEKIQSQLAETRQLREETLQRREQQEKEVRTLSQSYRKQENRLHEQEVRVNRLDVELNHLLQKLAEEYEISYERAKQEYEVPAEPAKAERRVRSLKSQITSLGDVNLGAIEEHNRLMERLDFLKTQEADLLEAKEKLYEIIRQLTEEMGRRFLESFEMIRTEFQDVFVKMFGGGRADLQLSEPDNLLETGIDIVAQPPGKKLQNLNLLSGGERALAALALLFAVLRIKPVPFCVLDEVDAALDEANLTRYTHYMKEFSGKTQFIIITHRKHTMEGADVLYGITMQESGVSKLVSVKLEEYDGSMEVASSQS
ncbi:chromosome segregation protein SMC [Thermoactinomyces daqus]|uniref:Chromosome partition protein Smc n=1 Tax=Thermoactinomyces daqus TaxID=1329516 RepID=A0A7W1XC99_9BACL|nr:chromosome segregation protein SMC [Thermoactinomyces daqus]MBA4544025.1 chromosome segregation protein SMC [Thermoactinomyces daqus]